MIENKIFIFIKTKIKIKRSFYFFLYNYYSNFAMPKTNDNSNELLDYIYLGEILETNNF